MRYSSGLKTRNLYVRILPLVPTFVMRFANITNAVYRQPWNITPGAWLSVHELLQSRLAVDAENLDLSAFVNPRPDLEVDSNGIAHIHVTGVLGKNLSQIERSCGNTGYEQLEAEIADAV